MTVIREKLSISKSLETLLNDIYADDEVSLAEYKTLQAEADLRWQKVIDELGPNNTLKSFQNSMDISMHLLYLSAEYAALQEVTDLGEAYVKDAMYAQVEYIQAGTQLALKLLRVGQNQP
ncbi:hypothetical protein [Pseudomonas sp. R2-60-08W]|uniref:hypothetical protein n=1 Tax=Pseudomonas sp. R2-60-08W TaxID=1173280 RepID=UPI000F582D2B|nr:hypothetical protein [Pseudomonas sp. R2-60-08W]AZF25010.1 hypothetical protein C4J90_0821 [Pseudomonas sp. R2-60-08W]